jgi:hypothetical protein
MMHADTSYLYNYHIFTGVFSWTNHPFKEPSTGMSWTTHMPAGLLDSLHAPHHPPEEKNLLAWWTETCKPQTVKRKEDIKTHRKNNDRK